jgi:hypothetical protein
MRMRFDLKAGRLAGRTTKSRATSAGNRRRRQPRGRAGRTFDLGASAGIGLANLLCYAVDNDLTLKAAAPNAMFEASLSISRLARLSTRSRRQHDEGSVHMGLKAEIAVNKERGPGALPFR